MSKKKDDKEKLKKHKQAASSIVASGSAYADGAPLDRVQYLEDFQEVVRCKCSLSQ